MAGHDLSAETSGFALSPQQSRAWEWARVAAPRTMCVVRVGAGAAEERLRARLAAMSSAHELLRTRFVRPLGLAEPLQAIGAPAATLSTRVWPELDASAAQLEALCASEREADADAESPPLRLILIECGAQAYLCVSASPLLFDGAGLLRFVRELLEEAPRGADNDSQEDGGTEPIQYVDVARWLESLLDPADEEAREGHAWWMRSVAERPVAALFPGERVQGGPWRPAQVALPLDAGLSAALSGWGSVAPSRLLALWSLLLKRATRQSTLALAVVCDGRADAELSEVMGPLTRHLPLCLAVDEQERLERAGARAHAQLEGLLEWQDYYRADVLGTGEDAGYLAHGFAYTEVPAGVPEVLGYAACAERSHAQLTVLSQAGSWRLLLDYDASRLEGAAMERLLRQYRSLLQSAVEMPQARLCELSHVGEEERRRLLSPSSADALPDARTVVELFSAEAARVPGRAALRAGDRVWTYAELEAASNRLAHYLIGQGVESESRVAVCLDREPQWIVSLLGVLKAGGVYVPIDPEFHPERVRSLLEDADCALWLSDGAHAGVLGEGGARLRLLDALEETLSGYPVVAPQVRTEPEALAYLIYTSGSTGRPKGVGVSHGAVHAYVSGVLPRLGLSEEAELLSLATIGADLGHTALFGALCSGRTLRLIGSSSVLDAEGLAEELGARPVDCLKIVPTHLRALLSASSPSRLLPRECLVLGGSALESGLVETVRGLSSCRIVNHYGPTETTVGATTHAVEGAVEGALPIGRALSGGRTYVLDAEGGLAGEGMPGELYIGGPAVARGYWGRPDLTAERFVPDAWSGEPGARMYRTGDLADVREGVVRFYGRVDHQVKIRGYRVELGEIESVLSGHPEVESACVVLAEGERLLGYVASSGTPSGATLREWLRDRLPEYMVPSGWHVMRHLPVTRNGKVDRSALPAIGDQGVRTRAYVAPRTELERTLAQLWSEVLGVEEVGVEDNYFELGGDSIVAIQVAARLNKQGYRLLPKQIFEHLTIGRIAQNLTPVDASGIDQGRVSGRFTLTPAQARFFELHPMGLAQYNLSVRLRPTAALDWAGVQAVFDALSTHHDGLRSRFMRDDQGSWWQDIPDTDGRTALHLVDLSALPSDRREEAMAAVVAQAQASLKLEGPLERVVGVRETRTEAPLLLWCVHHLLVDGVSWRVLLEDINLAAEQTLRGEPVALPAKTLSVLDWSERLQRRAGVLAESDEPRYWLARQGETGGRRPGLARDARSASIELDGEITKTLLKELPARLNTEIVDVLLTSLALGFDAWSGHGEPCVLDVELEGHGREPLDDAPDTTRSVGWFTSRYPLRLPSAGAHPIERLQAVKEAFRALPGRGVGFGLLRYCASDAGLRESLRALPVPDVSFNYLGQIQAPPAVESPFEVVPGSIADQHAGSALRAQSLAFSGLVSNGRLSLQLTYDARTHAPDRAEALLSGVAEALRALVAAALQLERVPHTPSDFPESGLEQAALDALLDQRPPLESIYPLAPLQYGLLFESLLRPGLGVNTLQQDIGLNGNLDEDALRDAWREIVRRHPVLRTIFHDLQGERPLQLVLRDATVDWRTIDWSDLDEKTQAERLLEYVEEDRRAPFEFERDPAMRVHLIRLGPDRLRMLWTRHHALVDGWSSAIVLRELIETYMHRSHGAEAALPPARGYRDYIRWLLERQRHPDAERWWLNHLDGIQAPTGIGVARDWHRRMSDAKAQEHLHAFPPQLGAELRSYAQRRNLTVGGVLQAAWALLIGSIAGSEDVVFGTVASGRPADLDGVETIVGPLINTLPLRVRIDGDEAGPWLQGLQREVLERDACSHLPLPRIQQLAGFSGTPLFASLLVVQNYVTEVQRRALESDHARIDFNLESGQTAYKISYPLTAFVTLAETDSVRLCYDGDSFDAGTVAGYGRRLEEFLALLVGDDLGAARARAREHWPVAPVLHARPNMRFHHMGVACSDIDEALEFVRAQFDVVAVGERVYDELQDADLCLIETANGANIELVAGPQVQGLLGRGVSLYHTCYEVDDLDAEILAAGARGASVVVEPRPARLFGGRRVCFLQTPLGLIELLETRRSAAEDDAPTESPTTLVAAGTFTIDPLKEALLHLCEQAAMPARIELAPYAQIFQSLLDPDSALRRNTTGANLLLLRWDDWFGGHDTESADEAEFERNFERFLEALAHAAGASATPLLLLVAPPRPDAERDPRMMEFHARGLHRLREASAGLTHVAVLCGRELIATHGVDAYFDAESEQVAHLPYTAEAFTAFAAGLLRAWHAVSRPLVKVVVADCDDTLWTGTVAEAGTEGVVLGPARLALQRRLVELHDAGVLICLCSRNIEQDVFAVFDRRPEMILRREHIVAARIDWRPKSENIRSLADELGLGLDAFVFIDDDDMQCADVRTHCPEALTLQVPRDEAALSRFVAHCWALDPPRATADARRRTELYRGNLARADERARAPSLREFVESLQLSIGIGPIGEDSVERVAELVLRTNQFNLTARRRTTAELAALLRDGRLAGFSVSLSDRFGEYGLVGAVLYTLGEGVLEVDSLLLSCRALGRGVEHRMLAELAERGMRAGCSLIRLDYVATERSQPMGDFLRAVVGAHASVRPECLRHDVPIEVLRDLRWEIPETAEDEPRPASPRATRGRARRRPDYAAVIAQLGDIAGLTAAIQLRGLSSVRALRAYEAPHDEYEEAVARIWAQLFGLPRLGRDDHFFELGGHSLIATRMIARCKQAYAVDLPLARIFEAPTVHAFAESLRHAVWARRAAEAAHEEVAADMEEGAI